MPASSNVLGFSRAFVCSADRVYISAHLPELEEQGVHLSVIIRWRGSWATYRVNWAVIGTCATEDPELTVLSMGPEGQIHVAVPSGFSEEAVDTSEEGPVSRGMLRDIQYIGEHFYVTGMGRQVYRRDAAGHWTRWDNGVVLPLGDARIAGFNSIDGYSETQLFAVGWGGEIWNYDGSMWHQIVSPTNLKLERVTCTRPGTVYACGQAGLLLRGFEDRWEVIEQDVTDDQFWGMAWFRDKLWLATTENVYHLEEDDELVKVDLGLGDDPITCGWLHASEDCMWSVGGHHLLSTVDGNEWTLHVVP